MNKAIQNVFAYFLLEHKSKNKYPISNDIFIQLH